ncbi:GbsR/MarR family transcriptional regulator [Halobacteriovorax sp. RZ-2]|uniref:GbsR/MarR family transcriptional regulator n=1 Tax=unclassified Halobacteriovorax TaxID=2639665 RepID=UPI0037136689
MKEAMDMDIEIVEKRLLEYLPHYEAFFSKVGFKRIEGAVFGVLVYSSRPLASDEIEKILGLSQPAVSSALKTLATYKMVISHDHPEIKRMKIHEANDDAINIVSNIVKKRELEIIEEFENITAESLKLVHDEKRKKRLTNILTTTRFARSLSEFIISISKELDNPYMAIEKFPMVTKVLKNSLTDINQIKSGITSGLKNSFLNIVSKIENEKHNNGVNE